MAKSSTSFKKGNPGGGRPKQDPEVKKLLESCTLVAVKKIMQLMQTSDDEGIQLKAAQYLCDRALGKPAQAVNLGDQDGNGLSIQVIVKEKQASE